MILGPISFASPSPGTPVASPSFSPLKAPIPERLPFWFYLAVWLTLHPGFTIVSFNSACLKQTPSSLLVLLHTSGILYLLGWHHQPRKELWATKAGQNWWPFKVAFVKWLSDISRGALKSCLWEVWRRGTCDFAHSLLSWAIRFWPHIYRLQLSQLTLSGWPPHPSLPRTSLVLSLKTLCLEKPLNAGQIWMVANPMSP